MANLPRWAYWERFAVLAAVSLGLLFLFVFGFLPQRFLLELDFSESDFEYPVVPPPLPPPPPPSPARRPIARGPAERFWSSYLALLEADEALRARRLLSDYLERHPDDLGAQVEYARALWRQGLLDAAVVAYRRALTLGAAPEVKRELAGLYLAAGRRSAALDLYAELLRARPGDLDLLSEYADAATWSERYDLALELFSRLVQRRPEDADLRLRWGRVLYWAGQPERALAVLDGLPSDYAVAAVDSLRAAIAVALPPPPDTGPPPPLPRLERARGFAMAGAVDSALALYRLELAESPEADSLLLELADVFQFRADAPDSATAYLRAFLARRPADRDARLRLARLLAWSGRFAEAEVEAIRLVETWPGDAEAWALLGDLHRWRGQRKAARAAYAEALELDADQPAAQAGVEVLETEIDALLARRGNVGPTGELDLFVDSDEYRRARVAGAWLAGTPRTRGGLGLAVEQLDGFAPEGGSAELTAATLEAVGERWWVERGLHVRAAAGVWLPESGASAEPTVSLALSAPDWGGATYRLELQHGPAYRETNTLEAGLSNLRVDLAGLEAYWPLTGRWELAARGRVARLSGAGDTNVRADAAVDLFYRPDDHWVLGLESRGLAFADAAPNPGRRLYWDPNWSWSNLAVLRWRGEPGPGWAVEAWATPGVAWLDERGLGATAVAELGAGLNLRRRLGVWTLAGSAGYSQSRADGYRSFRFDLGLSRGFGW